jgi:hypothetical protein
MLGAERLKELWVPLWSARACHFRGAIPHLDGRGHRDRIGSQCPGAGESHRKRRPADSGRVASTRSCDPEKEAHERPFQSRRISSVQHGMPARHRARPPLFGGDNLMKFLRSSHEILGKLTVPCSRPRADRARGRHLLLGGPACIIALVGFHDRLPQFASPPRWKMLPKILPTY